MSSDLIEMAERVRAFMRRSLERQHTEEEFNRLALELYALQLENNPAYAKLCGGSRKIKTYRKIPAAPTVAFKELEMTSLAAGDRTAVFFSSGTTQSERSRHFHSAKSLALYEESLWLWFERMFPRKIEGANWLFSTPPAALAANSSLVHMFETIAGHVKSNRIEVVGALDRDGGWGLNIEKLLNFLFLSEAEKQPVAIFGTAFLFVHLLDVLERSGTKVQMPAGSWALETGGYKGRTREIPKEELHGLVQQRLGIARENIFGEYGMSELSSQAYAGADGVFRFPPWARAVLISPATGREAADGERGLIRVYDLANVWSVMAVQTEDVGVKVGDGIRLVGRAAQSEARGCSLMAA